jgi:hypothetical protein
LHFSSLFGAKPTSVETPKMTFLTQSDRLPPLFDALRMGHSPISDVMSEQEQAGPSY